MSAFGKRFGGSGYARLSIKRTGEPTLPLINVVFLLLIFVLLTSVIEADPPVPVDLPFSAQPNTPNEEGQIVFLSADGRQASAVAAFAEGELESWVEENQPSLVAVRADRQSDVGAVFALAERLSALGVAQVELVVLSP